jgi:hypothetical protein
LQVKLEPTDKTDKAASKKASYKQACKTPTIARNHSPRWSNQNKFTLYDVSAQVGRSLRQAECCPLSCLCMLLYAWADADAKHLVSAAMPADLALLKQWSPHITSSFASRTATALPAVCLFKHARLCKFNMYAPPHYLTVRLGPRLLLASTTVETAILAHVCHIVWGPCLHQLL